jgi:AraC family transcriptional regulator of adaptative response/methylated-DNA-[protein]-cysteine methyltransferase
VLVATSDRGVVAVLLGDADAALRAELVARFARADCMPAAAPLRRAMAAVVRCVDGQGRDPGLPLDLRGTAFQQRLWALLGTIPAGTTVSYQDLATRLSMPAGARAVAAACAANPVAVLVPCHRVVRADGGLAGYRWGLDRKRALLARERGQG